MSLETALATVAALPVTIASVDQLDSVLVEMGEIIGVTSGGQTSPPTVE